MIQHYQKKVKERIDELKSEGKELVAFYDKVTKKIFINQNVKDEEIRASIAREYKIKEDLELGRGKENDKGQLRSTVAGEIAYDEIKDRLKKGDKNPISASSFDVAKMDKDSEVTADGYYEEIKVILKKVRATVEYVEHHEKLEKSEKSLEERKRISNNLKKNLELEYAKIDEKYQEELGEEATAHKRAVLIKKKLENSNDPYEQEYYKSYYDHLIRKSNPKKAFFKSAGKGAIKGVATMVLFEMTGLIPKPEPNITIPKSSKFYKDTRYPISAEDLYVISVNDPEYYKDNSHLYKVTGELNPKAGLYNKKIEDPVILKHMTEYHNNTLTNNEKLGDGLGNLIGYIGYVGANKLLNRLDAHIYKNSNSSLVSANKITNEEQLLLENKVNSVQRNVFINDGTPGGTTKAYQNITTYPDGSMSILQKNLTTGEISFQGINSSGQRVFETSLTPHEANTLIGANSSSKMLVGNGAVSQSVISKVSYQTRNNSLVLYDKTPVPVATNGTLVPPLTTNKELATVSLLTTGANKVSQVVTPPNYLTKPEEGGIMVVGAGTEAISGAYSIDINPIVKGVNKGDAENLVGIPDNFLSLVIIDNPTFNPVNTEILRVVKPGGEIRITGVISNSHFSQLYSKSRKTVKVPKGFELIEEGEIPENLRKQGYRNNGDPIGTKNGVGVPKKTDKIIRLRKK